MPRFLLFLGVMVGIGSGTMFTFHQPLALSRGSERISDFLVAYTIVAVGSASPSAGSPTGWAPGGWRSRASSSTGPSSPA